MAGHLPQEEWAAGFKWIESRCIVVPGDMRRCVRALARKGMLFFQRGLMDEDGMCAGSGYGVTAEGYAYVKGWMNG